MTDSAPVVEDPWDSWLTDALAHLRENNLLRTLRPVVPTLNAVEVRGGPA